ncbi:MAG TPA: DinB family protein [Gemmatimonadales bacterium]|nr:DinB family protein [Gemmatimonadales bacterium]
MKEWITNVITRELKALRREIETYPSEDELWDVRAGITNPGGNLALHLAGNIQYFIGNVLGQNGYVRNRDAEFADKDVPRAELLREIDNAIAAVETGMSKITEADLARPYPEAVGGISSTTGAFLAHFATHLAYHLGQVDYHRRILTGESKTVKTMALSELGGTKA